MKTLLLPILLLMLSPLAQSADTRGGRPFSVTVVPAHSSAESRRINIQDKSTRPFHVALTNVSARPQWVFETWNSWGYQAISFEFTMSDGRKAVASTKEQAFTRNFPSTFLLSPGEQYIYTVSLDNKWDIRPMPEKGESNLTLKAIYQISTSPEATEQGVWTGRIESKPYKISLWRSDS
jgi:hypothetical protein